MKKDNKGQSGQSKGKNHFQSMFDRYQSAARDALSSGDEIGYHRNLQFAEHYLRVTAERQQQEQANVRKQPQQKDASEPQEMCEQREQNSRQEDVIIENPIRKKRSKKPTVKQHDSDVTLVD